MLTSQKTATTAKGKIRAQEQVKGGNRQPAPPSDLSMSGPQPEGPAHSGRAFPPVNVSFQKINPYTHPQACPLVDSRSNQVGNKSTSLQHAQNPGLDVSCFANWVWWYMLLIQAVRRWRLKGQIFKVILGYTARDNESLSPEERS